jgi:hypothetical protein
LFFFGRARINIWRFFPKELKLVHFLPVAFTLFVLSIPFQILILEPLGKLSISVLLMYLLIVLISSTIENKSLKVGIESVPASFIQLFAYGMGFLKEAIVGKN